MTYITCDLLGPGDGLHNFGLGNQMFQIAALTSHAKDNDMIATFPQIKQPSFGGYDKNVFAKVRCEDINTSGFSYIQTPYVYQQLIKSDNIIFRGYFQSEKYFLHNREFILDLFKPSEEIRDYILSKYGSLLQENTLSIHIRRGDYVHLPNHHPTADMEYYSKALKYVLDKVAITKYVVFSDDIPWCKETFGDEDYIQYIEGESDYIDLYMMSMCKHNIIANSTFSWWGAWLNQNTDKIVVAPKQWFGSARSDLDTRDLIPSNWIKI